MVLQREKHRVFNPPNNGTGNTSMYGRSLNITNPPGPKFPSEKECYPNFDPKTGLPFKEG